MAEKTCGGNGVGEKETRIRGSDGRWFRAGGRSGRLLNHLSKSKQGTSYKWQMIFRNKLSYMWRI